MTELKLTRKDFVSDQTVRWCPGCGDYSILAQMQRVLPELGIPKEKIVFVSGIGCSSRFPYYMNTYGMHSVHGRAPTIATGLSISNPELNIWVITGDGDGLSIGGNHLLHAMRRNVNLNIVLFNNRIYGLTKGQYSPTSRAGKITKSSPMGSIDQPLNPIAVALAAESTFIARTLDSHPQHLGETLHRAAAHKGVSFIEIYQNCVIFNPTEWEGISDRRTRDDNILYLEHGKPMIFGNEQDQGIRMRGFQPEVVKLSDVDPEEIMVHDATSKSLVSLLASLEYPEFPAMLGVFRDVVKPTYEEELMGQVERAKEQKGTGDLNKLYRAADLWTVEARAEVKSDISGEISSGLDEEYLDTIDVDDESISPMQDLLISQPISVLDPAVPIEVDAHSSLARAIRQMNRHNIGCLLVTDAEDKLIGIFTERDVLNRVAGIVDDPAAVTIAEAMTPAPIALRADQAIAQALHLMSVHGFRHLPLVDEENRPTGIISFRDVVGYLSEALGQ